MNTRSSSRRSTASPWSEACANSLDSMNIRPKLTGAPLAYTTWLVDGTADHYAAFGKALWSDDQEVSPALKELVFLRSSIVNECPT